MYRHRPDVFLTFTLTHGMSSEPMPSSNRFLHLTQSTAHDWHIVTVTCKCNTKMDNIKNDHLPMDPSLQPQQFDATLVKQIPKHVFNNSVAKHEDEDEASVKSGYSLQVSACQKHNRSEDKDQELNLKEDVAEATEQEQQQQQHTDLELVLIAVFERGPMLIPTQFVRHITHFRSVPM